MFSQHREEGNVSYQDYSLPVVTNKEGIVVVQYCILIINLIL
jgi:hypothetical protein